MYDNCSIHFAVLGIENGWLTKSLDDFATSRTGTQINVTQFEFIRDSHSDAALFHMQVLVLSAPSWTFGLACIYVSIPFLSLCAFEIFPHVQGNSGMNFT